jgi:hypothetical protein
MTTNSASSNTASESRPGTLWIAGLIAAWSLSPPLAVAEESLLKPQAGPQNVLSLPPSAKNPRNSEGDFVQLKDGRLMFVYTHFTGGGGDHDRASLVARFSADKGRTWTGEDIEIVGTGESGWNVMSVSMLRLQDGRIALFYARKNSLTDCRPIMRTSSDEGQTWSEPTLCITDEIGYYVVNNDRVVQLENGRLVIPVALHNTPDYPKPDWNGHIMCYVSDDQGRSWRRSKSVMTAASKAGKRLIAQEPGIVELKDNRLMMFVRSNAGSQLLSFSKDAGDVWSPLMSSNIISPVSPASIERIPKTGDLILVWNNHHDVAPEYANKRTPFTVAISQDDGKTWGRARTLADNPSGWYCYTAIQFIDDHVLLGHCAGDRRKNNGLAETQVTRISLEWIYGQALRSRKEGK